MPLPKATPSSTKTPGFYLRINLAAGPNNAGTAALRGLLICHKGSDGNITPETERRTCYSADDVKTAIGNAQPGHLAAIMAFLAWGALILDVVATAAPSGGTPAAATNTLTITGAPTDTNYWEIDVAGRKTGAIGWFVGESITTFRTRLMAAINELNSSTTNPSPALATAGGAGVVNLTAISNGDWGNDVTYGFTKLSGSGGTIAAAGSKLAAGVGTISVTAALALVDVNEYDAICLASSNTDAIDATGTSNAELLMTHIESHQDGGNSMLQYGGNSMLQYGFVGCTDTIANVKAGAIGRNSKVMTYAYAQNAQSLPAEFAGWEMGDALRWYSVRANWNRIGNPASNLLYGSKNREADLLRFNESEDLLSNGVTPYDFAPRSDQLRLIKPITTYSFIGSNPDYRCHYQSDVFGQFAFAKDLRASLPVEFANCSITEDLPPGDDALPEGVVERRDVETFTFAKGRSWARGGVLHKLYLEESIENGTFAVEIDEDDESQVNIFIPDKIVKPLAKIGVVINKVG